MTKLTSPLRSIVEDNLGRDPTLLAMKWEKMKASPFGFYRGTAPLFYRLWSRENVPASPPVWICGDAHLENVGSYKGDNGIPYFDLNDFDEACLAPVMWDVGRALAGLMLLGEAQAAGAFLAAYLETVAGGKPGHIEPEVATGPIAVLLHAVASRRRKDFLAARVRHGRISIRAGRSYTLVPKVKKRVTADFSDWAERQPDAVFYRVLDVCGRISGTGSLGLKRYVVLVKGHRLPFLMDMKEAAPAAPLRAGTGRHATQPRWESEAERVATAQRFLEYVPFARLGWTRTKDTSYIIRALQPVEDRIDAGKLSRKRFAEFVRQWAGLLASAHLRAGGWKGSADLDRQMAFARSFGPRARRQLLKAARRVASRQMKIYRKFKKTALRPRPPAQFR